MKIAYQGIEGSYSESCAKEIYPDCKTIPCKTFDEVFTKANQDGEVRAMIPESNKTTGNIGLEYLIFKYRLNIYEEKFYPIRHHLLGLPGTKIQDIKNVYSHAQGLSEGSINSSQITTMVKATPPSINSSSLDLGELRRGFHKKIWQKVAKAKYYPRVARKSGFEGEPIVTFTLGSKGELIDLRLIEFSSYQLLNEAALETVRRGIPYPSIPKPLGRDSISFNLPISYVLEE